jgi:hypothetical protein
MNLLLIIFAKENQKMLATCLSLLLPVAIGSILLGKRKIGLTALSIFLVLSFFVLWYLISGNLKI